MLIINASQVAKPLKFREENTKYITSLIVAMALLK